MKYEKEELSNIDVHSLRNLAREIGVRAPTSLKKAELIDEIIQIKKGVKQPYTLKKAGRPLKYRIERGSKKELINYILKEIEKNLNNIL